MTPPVFEQAVCMLRRKKTHLYIGISWFFSHFCQVAACCIKDEEHADLVFTCHHILVLRVHHLVSARHCRCTIRSNESKETDPRRQIQWHRDWWTSIITLTKAVHRIFRELDIFGPVKQADLMQCLELVCMGQRCHLMQVKGRLPATTGMALATGKPGELEEVWTMSSISAFP